MTRIFVFLTILSVATACGSQPNAVNAPKTNTNVRASTSPPTVYTYEVVKSYPHDPKAFTQGLIFHDGFLYESTGQEGESTLRKVNLETGKVVQKYDLPNEVFAEGITIVGDEIYQLSWRNQMGWAYNLADFKLLREFNYQGEGWGMTTDGANIYVSDGTHIIRIVNPTDFKTMRTIAVNDDRGRPLMKLNELEWVKGEIWANIWHSEEIGKPNNIARIDPATGKLLGWIDLAGISPQDQDDDSESENTLNGIAYDSSGDRIFVTGKRWKKLYEIRIKPRT